MNRSYIPDLVKVAIVQHSPVFLNLEESLHKACGLIEEAAGQGVQVIAFPETWLPGYPVWLDFSPNAALWDHPPAKALYRLLVENSIYLAGPLFDESGIIHAGLQLERITEGRLLLDTSGHYARPDVFHLEVNDQPQSGIVFESQRERP